MLCRGSPGPPDRAPPPPHLPTRAARSDPNRMSSTSRFVDSWVTVVRERGVKNSSGRGCRAFASVEAWGGRGGVRQPLDTSTARWLHSVFVRVWTSTVSVLFARLGDCKLQRSTSQHSLLIPDSSYFFAAVWKARFTVVGQLCPPLACCPAVVGWSPAMAATQMADIVREQAGKVTQWESHNDALKSFRHQILQHQWGEIDLPMEGEVEARRVEHDAKGPGFSITDSLTPWSWKGMLAAMKPADAERAVGPGIVSASVKRRQGSYDHVFAAVAVSKGWSWPGSDTEPPPVVDFAFRRVDGSTVLVHPRRKKGTVDIVVEGPKAVGVHPPKGFGKSQGRGTFRRYKTGAYDPDRAFEPGEAAAVYPRVAATPWVGSGAAGPRDGPAVAGPSGEGNVPRAQPPPQHAEVVVGDQRGWPPQHASQTTGTARPTATATHPASPAVVGTQGGASGPAVAGPSGGGPSPQHQPPPEPPLQPPPPPQQQPLPPPGHFGRPSYYTS